MRYLKNCIGSNVPETQPAADTISTATATAIPPVIPASDKLSTLSTKRPLSPTSSDSGNPAKVRPVASDYPPLVELDQHTPETGTYLPDAYFSGDKTEACLEDNPRDMMKVFVEKTLSLFEQDIAKVKWSPRYSKLRLKRDAYDLGSVFLILRPETMTFTLKKKMINVQNDGAIVLRDDNKMIWFDRDVPKVIDGKPPKPKVMKTILSIEVSFLNISLIFRERGKKRVMNGLLLDKSSPKCWAKCVIRPCTIWIPASTLKYLAFPLFQVSNRLGRHSLFMCVTLMPDSFIANFLLPTSETSLNMDMTTPTSLKPKASNSSIQSCSNYAIPVPVKHSSNNYASSLPI